MGLSSTTLSLLIALFSVLGYVGPQVKGWFSTPRDRSLFRLVTVEPDFNEARVLVTNAGERAAALRSVVLEGLDYDGHEKRIALHAPDGSLVAEPGTSRDFAFYATHALPRMIAPIPDELCGEPGQAGGTSDGELSVGAGTSKKSRWALTVTYVDSEGVQQTKTLCFWAKVEPATGMEIEPLRIRSLELLDFDGAGVVAADLGSKETYVEIKVMAPPWSGPDSELWTLDVVSIGPWQTTMISQKQGARYANEEDVVFLQGLETVSVSLPAGVLETTPGELEVTLIDAWGDKVATGTLEVFAQSEVALPQRGGGDL